MDITEIIREIKDELVRNGGTWDLTDDNGEPTVYDEEKQLSIPDLTISENSGVCAMIPLSYFCDDTIKKVHSVIGHTDKPQPDTGCKVICTKCGGTNVTCDAVINPNTKEFKRYGSEAFLDGNCNDCDDWVYLVDVNEVLEKLQLEYDDFLKSMGTEPEVASCEIVWKDGKKCEDVRIKLNTDKQDGDDIFFYCNSLDELKSFTDFCGKDFMISWIYNFQ